MAKLLKKDMKPRVMTSSPRRSSEQMPSLSVRRRRADKYLIMDKYEKKLLKKLSPAQLQEIAEIGRAIMKHAGSSEYMRREIWNKRKHDFHSLDAILSLIELQTKQDTSRNLCRLYPSLYNLITVKPNDTKMFGESKPNSEGVVEECTRTNRGERKSRGRDHAIKAVLSVNADFPKQSTENSALSKIDNRKRRKNTRDTRIKIVEVCDKSHNSYHAVDNVPWSNITKMSAGVKPHTTRRELKYDIVNERIPNVKDVSPNGKKESKQGGYMELGIEKDYESKNIQENENTSRRSCKLLKSVTGKLKKRKGNSADAEEHGDSKDVLKDCEVEKRNIEENDNEEQKRRPLTLFSCIARKLKKKKKTDIKENGLEKEENETKGKTNNKRPRLRLSVSISRNSNKGNEAENKDISDTENVNDNKGETLVNTKLNIKEVPIKPIKQVRFMPEIFYINSELSEGSRKDSSNEECLIEDMEYDSDDTDNQCSWDDSLQDIADISEDEIEDSNSISKSLSVQVDPTKN